MAAQPAGPDLPVSLERIRKALEQPPGQRLKLMDDAPMFRSFIRERLRIEALLETLTFDSGPVVRGGLYAYEQQQTITPKVQNPLAQPYSAFTPGELLQVSATSLVADYLAGPIVRAVTSAERRRAEAAAREEVRRALQEYWAAQAAAHPVASR